MDPYVGPDFLTAANTQFRPIGCVEINLQLSEKHSIKHRFCVFNELSADVILGDDFFHATESQLSYSPTPLNFDQVIPPRSNTLHAIDMVGQEAINKLISKYPDVFTEKLGRTNLLQFKIEVTENIPKRQRPYSTTPFKQAIIESEIQKYLENDLIEETTDCDWASPCFLVPKPPDPNKPAGPVQYRLVLDFRYLNSKTKTVAYFMPTIRQIINRIGAKKFISKIDLRKFYHQIPLHPDSKNFTGFQVGHKFYRFKVCPFGVKNGAAIAQALITRTLDGLLGKICEAYQDDILIASDTFEDHLLHLEEVAKRLQQAGLTVSLDKCEFGKTELIYLGYTLGPDGIKVNPEKIKAIKEYPRPQNVKQLRQFMGLCSWVREFIPSLGTLAEPLIQLTRKSQAWTWGPPQEQAFASLKDKLISAPILSYPNFKHPFFLAVDSSDIGAGAVLFQHYDNRKHVVSYASVTFNPTQRRLHAMERELLGILFATAKFREYLDGRRFTLLTDNKSLTYMYSLTDHNKKLARWSLRLTEYDFDICHIPGAQNTVPDVLSRNPCSDILGDDVDDLDSFLPNSNSIRLDTLSLDRIKSAQTSDSEVQAIHRSSNKFNTPYKIRHGILYRDVFTDPDVSSWRVYLPESLRLYAL